MANKSNTKSSVDEKVDGWEKEEVSELEQMKIDMASLKQQLEVALEKINEEKEEEAGNSYPRDIRQDEYIPVMNLLPYTLNLSTEGMGRGRVKKFRNFGEIKRILYSDLVDIMDSHPNFVNSGFFYILDKNVIRKHGLDEAYESILDKEKIEKILDTKSEECVDLYQTANEKQQKIIVRLLISKMKEDPDSVNLNVIDKISRESEIDIREKVRDAKAFDEALLAEDED